LDSLAISHVPRTMLPCPSVWTVDEPRNSVHIWSPKEKSRKRKNDSNKRGEYWKLDDVSNQMREPVIKLMAEKVIAHAAGNGGRRLREGSG
jgi:hypothetical protein